jgi:DNA-binding CsgD family transcriptional regulator
VSVDDLDEAQAVIELAIELIAERLQTDGVHEAAEVREFAEMLVALERTLVEFRAQARSERLDALANVSDALLRLRQVVGAEELLPAAISELCQSCDFDRGLILKPEGQHLRVAAAFDPSDRARTDQLVGTAVALDRRTIEAEAIRRRGAAVVGGQPVEDGSHSTLSKWRGAAPRLAVAVLSAGQVLGVASVDRALTARPFRRIDHDSLAGFSLGLGYALERAMLTRRLMSQGEEVARLARAAATLASDMAKPELRLDARHPGTASDIAGALLAPPPSSTNDLLSIREQEVLELMATGATNSQIAAALFVSDETVKSHVKRIFRKLGATNRAQAVGFLRGDSGHPPPEAPAGP